MAALGSWMFVRFVVVTCALALTWLSARTCAAQHNPTATVVKVDIGARATARTELANLNAQQHREVLKVEEKVVSPWLVAAASTTAAFAASYAVLSGFSYKNSNAAARSMERSRELGLGLDMRLRLNEQNSVAQTRADLLARVSDICVAGAVMSAGATLLIWLTGKRKRQEQQMRALIGPMVLRGVNGGGVVVRAKF